MDFKKLDRKLHRQTADEVIAKWNKEAAARMASWKWAMEIIAEARKLRG